MDDELDHYYKILELHYMDHEFKAFMENYEGEIRPNKAEAFKYMATQLRSQIPQIFVV